MSGFGRNCIEQMGNLRMRDLLRTASPTVLGQPFSRMEISIRLGYLEKKDFFWDRNTMITGRCGLMECMSTIVNMAPITRCLGAAIIGMEN